MSYDKSKFSFVQTFNNADGRTSGSGLIGIITGLIGAAGMIAGIVGYFLQIPDTLALLGVMLKLIAAATLLLGVRKVSSDVNSKKLADANKILTETRIKVNLANAKAEEDAKRL